MCDCRGFRVWWGIFAANFFFHFCPYHKKLYWICQNCVMKLQLELFHSVILALLLKRWELLRTILTQVLSVLYKILWYLHFTLAFLFHFTLLFMKFQKTNLNLLVQHIFISYVQMLTTEFIMMK